jgi:hypothetical protein
MPFMVAVIVDVPTDKPVADPAEPAAFDIDATAGVLELQFTELVRITLVLSESVPVAMNCSVSPLGRLGSAGVTAIEVSGASTVITVLEVREPSVAVIVEVPGATAFARPLEPAVFEIVAAAVFEELHVTAFVTSLVEPLANMAVAVNCSVPPMVTFGALGVTTIDVGAKTTTVLAIPLVWPPPRSDPWILQ